MGFAVRTSLVFVIPEDAVGINETPMTWRIPRTNNQHMTAICAYAPTLDSDDAIKDEFYNGLHTLVLVIPRAHMMLLMGDIKARVGTSSHLWESVLGKQGVGTCNGKGLLFPTFCAEHNL